MIKYCSSATRLFTVAPISIMLNPRLGVSSAARNASYFFRSPYTIVILTRPQRGRGLMQWATPIESVHQAKNPHKAIKETDAIFVGGGNTFRLLKALQDLDLIEPIRQKVRGGAPYIGSSAGSNVAGPTIKTTKDMPIVQPRSFDSLGLVPFQISPHYQDPDPNSRHMGETQEERILQFLEENDTPVVGMREGAWLLVEGCSVMLKGLSGARIFRRGQPPVEALPISQISELVGVVNEN